MGASPKQRVASFTIRLVASEFPHLHLLLESAPCISLALLRISPRHFESLWPDWIKKMFYIAFRQRVTKTSVFNELRGRCSFSLVGNP